MIAGQYQQILYTPRVCPCFPLHMGHRRCVRPLSSGGDRVCVCLFHVHCMQCCLQWICLLVGGARVLEKQATIPAPPILNSLAWEAVLLQVVDVGVEGRGVQEVGSG